MKTFDKSNEVVAILNFLMVCTVNVESELDLIIYACLNNFS